MDAGRCLYSSVDNGGGWPVRNGARRAANRTGSWSSNGPGSSVAAVCEARRMVHRLVGSVGVLGRERAPAPAWAATTTWVTLASPVPLCSTIATWAGLMKTSPSPSWRLNCTRFIGCPPLAEHVLALSAYPTACTGGTGISWCRSRAIRPGFRARSSRTRCRDVQCICPSRGGREAPEVARRT